MGAVLPKPVSRKYELATHHLVIRYAGEVIDLRKITLAKAHELYRSGNFPYLRLKEKKA